jgi:hypothetical protein
MGEREGSSNVRYTVLVLVAFALVALVTLAVIILASPGFWWIVHHTA